MPAPFLHPAPLPRLLAPKPLAAALGAVLLAHWLLLDTPLRWPSEGAMTAPTEQVFPVSLQTHSKVPAPTQAPLPDQPTLATAPLAAAAPNASRKPVVTVTGPVTPKPANFEKKVPATPVTIARTAPDFIVDGTPPSPPTPPPEDGPGSSSAGTAATVALGTTAASALAAEPVRQYQFPAPALIKYEVRASVKGINLTLNGELLWQHDGKNYNARLEFTHFLLGSRMQTSKGQLGPQGLEPLRFGDKVRSEVAAHFDKAAAKVTFSANTPDVALTPGMQDQLSAVLQLSAMLAAEPQRYPAGTEIPFQAVGPRSVEAWTFTVGETEKLSMPGGELQAIKLSRPPAGPHSNRADIWFAPSQGYLPVRIRLTEANGDIADNLWRGTQPP
ncbi:MAG: DUF3108 domain-containing protein [Rhodoferax sp.]|nr:DUF3108 domain-containing protein [Rhodoferax sp.]